MNKRLWGAALVLGLVLSSGPLAGHADPIPGSVPSPSPDATVSPSESPEPEPAEPTQSASSPAPDPEPTLPEPDPSPEPEPVLPEPEVEPAEEAPIAVNARAASGTMTVGSSPGGFQLGSDYVFAGTATPGSSVTVWWDVEPARGWRKFGTARVAANGTYRLVLPITSSAVFRFIATGGNVPGAGGWQSSVARVTAGTSAVLTVGSAPGGFQVGSNYVFTGRTTPNGKVTIWWDAQPFKGWRAFGRATASASGAFRIVLPLGSAARFKFAATAGDRPGAGGGSWETYPSYVNTVYRGTNPTVLSVTSGSGAFLVGGTYVFTGRTTPGSPVTIWWDAAPYRGWRAFTSTTADALGRYRVTMPMTSAAAFRFAASSGHSPSTRTAGGWQSAAVGVTVRPQPTMRLDPRCLTGRVICVSKAQSELAWVVNGKIQFTMDARFGSSRLPTRNGAFRITWKSRNHVSSIYHSAMPFSLFFDGGRAVHFSRSFLENGYNGNSAGCVNTRDYELTGKLFDLARVGDKVIVF